jgi:hypothetical protein
MDSLKAKTGVYTIAWLYCNVKRKCSDLAHFAKICTAANHLPLSFLSMLVVKTLLQELQLSKVLYLRRKMVLFNRLFVNK